MRWNHSIVYEFDFKNTWQASDDALILAIELGSWTGWKSPSIAPELGPCVPQFLNVSQGAIRNKLHFDEEIEIAFFPHDDDSNFFSYHSCKMTHADLSTWNMQDGKPWRLRPAPRQQGPLECSGSDDAHGTLEISGATASPSVGPPMSHLPSGWIDDVWQLLQDEGLPAEDDDTSHVVFLTSYYLDHERVQQNDQARPLRFDDESSDWEQGVRLVWEDLADPHSPLDVVIVRPQPPFTAFPGTAATVIVHQNWRPDREPCLVSTVHISDPRTRFDATALSSPGALLPPQLLRLVGVEDLCHQRQQDGCGPCTVHIGFEEIANDQHIAVVKGLGITIKVPSTLSAAEAEHNLDVRVQADRRGREPHEWDPPDPRSLDDHPEITHRGEDPEDTVAFMARRPAPRLARRDAHEVTSSTSPSSVSTSSSMAPDYRHTVIFTLERRSVAASLPWHDDRELFDQVARALRIQQTDLLQTYRVSHRPPDFIQGDLQCLLVQRTNEHRPTPFDRIVLLETELTVPNDAQATPFQRTARWVPHRISWSSIFRLLGLERLGQQQAEHCHLWHNNALVDRNRISFFNVEDGDFIRIYIGEIPSDDSCDTELSEDSATSMDYRTTEGSEELALFQHSVNLGPLPLTTKLDDDSVVDGPQFCVSVHSPDPPGRPELTFGDTFECIESLRALWYLYADIELEEEGRVLYAHTWYSDATRWPNCDASRSIRLLSNLHAWRDLIAETWDDRVDPDAVVHLYLVNPQPRGNLWETYPMPHILIVQHPLREWRSLHISLLDPLQHVHGILQQVRVVPAESTRDHVLLSSNLQEECLADSNIDCMVWWDELEFLPGLQHRLPQGAGLVIIMNRISQAASSEQPWTPSVIQPPQDDEAPSEDSVSLLQVQSRKKALKLELDVLIPETSPLRLVAGCPMAPLPTYIECPKHYTNGDIVGELQSWGHMCDVFCFAPQPVVLCVPRGWHVHDAQFHYMFCHLDTSDEQGAFLHTHHCAMNELALMQFLYECGYWRASILEVQDLPCGIQRVLFANVKVETAFPVPAMKQKPPWPAMPSKPADHSCFFEIPDMIVDDDCVIGFGMPLQDIVTFFTPHENFLCRDPTGYAFPETTMRHLGISDSQELNAFERIIIYTDGSSAALDRHRPALWNAEKGHADTWAFTVLGERWTDGHYITEVLGWTAQEVLYENDCAHYLGAEYLGAYLAEREALTWAAFWRLSQNTRVPTIFRTDSMLSARQARGEIGSQDYQGLSFATFRGAFQALEAALGPDGLLIEHIPGHCDEPFNDMVDWLATKEREKSFYFPRQSLPPEFVRKLVPYLWTLFSRHDGLPLPCATGLHAPAPCLPATDLDNDAILTEAPQSVHALSCLSIATANIASMYNGPWGHAGKTGYLRQQFKSLQLNLIGLQETRTPEGLCCTDNVLRICTGCHKGQGGIELWVNLDVPFMFLDGRAVHFRKDDFQVLHRDPQSMLVRADRNDAHFAFLIGHAPHSGLPDQIVADWWEGFSALASRKQDHDLLFVLVDANADPGCPDGRHVLDSGFKTTSNTPFLRRFLSDHDLCLPATGDRHSGPTATWCSPNGQHLHCIDHVAIPCHALSTCTFSGVLSEFDLGNGLWDHSATGLQLQWHCSVTIPSVLEKMGNKPATRHDKQRLTTAHVSAVIDNIQVQPWHADIEHHVQHITEEVLTGLARHCPRQRAQPKKPFLTQEIWHLRQCKLGRRQTLKTIQARLRHELLRACFAGLRDRREHPDPLRFRNYEVWLRCCQVHAYCGFHLAAQSVRSHLKQAKNRHLQNLFEQLPTDAPASIILYELKKVIGTTNFKKFALQPLPCIRDEQGVTCQTSFEARECWISFFQAMEGGVRLPPSEQRREFSICKNFNQRSCNWTLQIYLASLRWKLRFDASIRIRQRDRTESKPPCATSIPLALQRRCMLCCSRPTFTGRNAFCTKAGVFNPFGSKKDPKINAAPIAAFLFHPMLGKLFIAAYGNIRRHCLNAFFNNNS